MKHSNKYIRLAVCMAICLSLFAIPAMAQDGDSSPLSGGSYTQINQTLDKQDTWQQIVETSAFSLGEPEQMGEIDGNPIYSMPYGSYPSIDGSTVAVPMALEFARQHLALSEQDLPGFVFFTTTHSAYVNLIEKKANPAPMLPSMAAQMDGEHPVDLMIGTEPSDEELALAEQHGVTLVREPLCFDAFVFITHKDNPVDSLTVEQIQVIYGGKITNWKEVGGNDEAIVAYQRQKNSGSQTAMELLVMQGEPLVAALDNYVPSSMSGLVGRVGEYENGVMSIGYTYLYYIDELYRNEDVKVLEIDGIAPTPENLRADAYPFTTRYYGVIRQGDEEMAGGLFLEWMLSAEGQRTIAQAGYIPVMENP